MRFCRSRLAGAVVRYCAAALLLNLAWFPRPAFAQPAPPPKKVLMVFNESRDLPGVSMLEKAVRAELDKSGSNRIELFAESLDVSRFSGPGQSRVFEDFLQRKYAGQNVDLVLAFMARDFDLASKLPPSLCSNVVFVSVTELEVPQELVNRGFRGIVQRIDVEGTLHLIFRLQPDTRRVVVLGGISPADRLTLGRLEQAAAKIDGIQFDFWTNRPVQQIREDLKKLPEDTAVFLSTIQQDVSGQHFHSVQLAPEFAEKGTAPLYVLGAGSVGSGAVGGAVVDFERLGARMGQLARGSLSGAPPPEPAVEEYAHGTPMVDWRALRRWDINRNLLPLDCVVRYQPHTIWGDYKGYFFGALAVMIAQGATIAGLLTQRARRRRAEAELQTHRAELAHAARVSTMGQLASAIAHELNQPLGAILRNAEAAELFLKKDSPNIQEVRAALADIRKDDQRAGEVIDRMRMFLKRRTPETMRLDLEDLLKETLALARPDAASRRVALGLEITEPLPPIEADRVQLQQVILNLVLNAMDATDQSNGGGRAVMVRTRTIGTAEVQVEVSDKGAGIPVNNMPRLFEPFYTTKEGGMGMGLAISKTIIEAHGGKIWAENNPEGGAIFRFKLPVRAELPLTAMKPVP